MREYITLLSSKDMGMSRPVPEALDFIPGGVYVGGHCWAFECLSLLGGIFSSKEDVFFLYVTLNAKS